MQQIADELNISKSSVSVWVRHIVLTQVAQKRIQKREKVGRDLGNATLKIKHDRMKLEIRDEAFLFIKKLGPLHKENQILLFALIYWCEGAKDARVGIAFTNSDPKLVRFVVDTLVSCFDISRGSLKAVLHLHSYHNEAVQKRFWAKQIGIELSQFRKTFHKSESGITIKPDYPGCISLRCYDSMLARKVLYIAQEYLSSLGA